MRPLLTFIIGVLCIGSALADSPGFPQSRVEASPSGTAFFLIASKYHTRPDRLEGSDFGVAYSVQRDGTFRKLWRVKGWSAYGVYISDNGRFLVRIGDWPMGDGPSKDDLALAFYRDGILQRQYSTADLVKDFGRVSKSISHYIWIYSFTPQKFREQGWPSDTPRLDRNDVFHLMTSDGIQYEFDASTGEIQKTTALLTKRSS